MVISIEGLFRIKRSLQMKIISGNLYFISDEFFKKINDNYLKKDHQSTKRPHYIAFKDNSSELYWAVPCSTQYEKYEKIIAKRQHDNKPTDTIKVVRTKGIKQVLLFQDMFPVTSKYVESPYLVNNAPLGIQDPKLISSLERNAKKVIALLHQGKKFTPTQPDIPRIEKIMRTELQQQQVHDDQTISKGQRSTVQPSVDGSPATPLQKLPFKDIAYNAMQRADQHNTRISKQIVQSHNQPDHDCR